MSTFPDLRQKYEHDCGVAIAYMGAFLNGIDISYQEVYDKVSCDLRGTHPEHLSQFYDDIGLKVSVIEPVEIDDVKRALRKNYLVACPINIYNGHWIMLYKIIKKNVAYHCPADGRKKIPLDKLVELWYDYDRNNVLHNRYAIIIKGKRNDANFSKRKRHSS